MNYRQSPLSEGKAGRVHGGTGCHGSSRKEPTITSRWRNRFDAQVYGVARHEVAAACGESRLPLQLIPWAPQHGSAGLAQNGLYVLRPDAYVGLADKSAAAEVLRGYFATREILV